MSLKFQFELDGGMPALMVHLFADNAPGVGMRCSSGPAASNLLAAPAPTTGSRISILGAGLPIGWFSTGQAPDSGYALDVRQSGFGLVSLSFHANAAYADPLTPGQLYS